MDFITELPETDGCSTCLCDDIVVVNIHALHIIENFTTSVASQPSLVEFSFKSSSIVGFYVLGSLKHPGKRKNISLHDLTTVSD